MSETIGYIGMFILFWSSIPHIRRMMQTKSSRDVSVQGWAMVWLGYALLSVQSFFGSPLVFKINFIGNAILIGTITFLAVYYRKRK